MQGSLERSYTQFNSDETSAVWEKQVKRVEAEHLKRKSGSAAGLWRFIHPPFLCNVLKLIRLPPRLISGRGRDTIRGAARRAASNRRVSCTCPQKHIEPITPYLSCPSPATPPLACTSAAPPGWASCPRYGCRWGSRPSSPVGRQHWQVQLLRLIRCPELNWMNWKKIPGFKAKSYFKDSSQEFKRFAVFAVAAGTWISTSEQSNSSSDSTLNVWRI